MRNFKQSVPVCVLLWVVTLYGQETGNRTVLFQSSTYGRLRQGAFEGELDIREVKKHGDMGLGTFNGADGEMVALDGKFYYIDLDGVARLADDNARVPFAQVTFFDNPRIVRMDPFADYGELKGNIDNGIVNKNVLYAIQVTGRFHSLKLRSLPKQEKPYPLLDSVLAHQKVSNLKDIEGTLIGFWAPASVGELSAVGYHSHFISRDRTKGGHVLEVSAVAALTAKIQTIEKYELVFLRGE